MPPRKKCRAIEESGWFRGVETKFSSSVASRTAEADYSQRVVRLRTFGATPRQGAELFSRDTTFFDFVEESLIADAELLGGTPPVPSYLAQRLFDHRPFGLHRGGFRDIGQTRRSRFSLRLGRHRRLVEVG